MPTGYTVKTETRVTAFLTERDIQRARVNAGLEILLPPETVAVVIRVVDEEELAEVEERPRIVAGSGPNRAETAF